MSVELIAALGALFFVTAVLYSSVGQAGATGYLAAMALLGLAPEFMRPTALVLNILVATIATVKFYRAGAFSWSLFWPFALASIPAAFVGGALTLPAALYRPLVGAALLVAAIPLLRGQLRLAVESVQPPPRLIALAAGGAIGLLSGLTGVGGGVFLTPMLLALRWAQPRAAAAIAALFILVNSISALAGLFVGAVALPRALPIWALLVVAGGWLGSEYGSRRLGNRALLRVLGVVLVIAGVRLVAMR